MNSKPNKILLFLCLILCMLASGFMTLIYLKKESIPLQKVIISDIDFDNIHDPLNLNKTTVVDLNDLKGDQKKEMDERKAKYGLKKEIDAILNQDESMKINKKTVPMKKILDKVKIKEGRVVEDNLREKNKMPAANKMPKTGNKNEYGIHIVKKGENIWNIHFEFLKNYFANKNIKLTDRSDEPLANRKSSGVGKILKFSERMVYIYSVEDQKLTDDINIIQPKTKVVVYNMKEVFDLLGKIDYSKINEIHFDGKTIWLPEN